MKKLALIFPGIGYTCDKPLLYYASKLACQNGYETIGIKYNYKPKESIRGNEEKMKSVFMEIYKDACFQLDKIGFEDYEEIIFISKSIGTVVATVYASKMNISCKHILLTPLKYTFDNPIESGIAYIGTNDTWSNVDEVIKIANSHGVQMHSFEKLNHSLEGDNIYENVEVLIEILRSMDTYMSHSSQN